MYRQGVLFGVGDSLSAGNSLGDNLIYSSYSLSIMLD